MFLMFLFRFWVEPFLLHRQGQVYQEANRAEHRPKYGDANDTRFDLIKRE